MDKWRSSDWQRYAIPDVLSFALQHDASTTAGFAGHRRDHWPPLFRLWIAAALDGDPQSSKMLRRWFHLTPDDAGPKSEMESA
jgi:hypothetical protein